MKQYSKYSVVQGSVQMSPCILQCVGSDAQGSFNPESNIQHSEIVAIITGVNL